MMRSGMGLLFRGSRDAGTRVDPCLARTLKLMLALALPRAAAPALAAQPTAAAAADGAEQPVAIQGPPPPEPPAVFTRDAAGRMTIRAIRLTEPLDIDGTLDEPFYRDVPGLTDFVQVEPMEGEPATEQTEVWLAFDDDNVYISARCWDSAPESRWIANELRRDSFNIAQNEYIDIVLDTFYDRRNGINLTVNPLGGRMDGQITDERDYSADWNPIWSVRAGRFPGGWTFESAIPFKSLRYRPGRAQVWGFSLTRQVRWKNELSSLVPLPVSRGIMLISQAATVVGIEAPDDGGCVLEIKPYAIGDLTTDRGVVPALSNALHAEAGLDVKYALTQNLVADATVNTDFAQVEVDEQQVNLTRFGLFYPEKREFFLENQGCSRSAERPTTCSGAPAPTCRFCSTAAASAWRSTVAWRPRCRWRRRAPDRRVGPFSVGALHIRTGNQPRTDTVATDFSVVRVKRDVLRRSSVGALAARRSVSRRGSGANDTYGVDGTFSFYDDLNINTYWARTATAGMQDDLSYRAQLDYAGDRYGVQLERARGRARLNPGDRVPAAGRLRGQLRRVALQPAARGDRGHPATDLGGPRRPYRGSHRLLETREQIARFGIEFENSDVFDVFYTRSYEFLKQPFQLAPEVVLPVDGYDFQQVEVSFALGGQRPFAGSLGVVRGSFYGGDKTTVNLAGDGWRSRRGCRSSPASRSTGSTFRRAGSRPSC